jgi:hypothetical protein
VEEAVEVGEAEEEPVLASVSVEEVAAEVEEEVVEAVAAVAVPASVDRLARRKAKLLQQHQRESPYPRLARVHYCG